MDKNSLLDAGAAAAGAAVGSNIGVVVAGPAGAIGGATLGALAQSAVQWIGKEIKDRQLSKREERKIGTVYELAQQIIAEKLKEGKEIRNDDFFTQKEENRSSAEEITEEAFFAAQRESEEKKLPYLSYLYANIFFDETVDKHMAVQLFRMAERLTYRQFQILTMLGGIQLTIESTGFQPLKVDTFKTISGFKDISIATDIFGLYREGIIQSKSAVLDPAGITPADLHVGGCGALLYNLMELNKAPFESSTSDIIQLLSNKEIVEITDKRLVIRK